MEQSDYRRICVCCNHHLSDGKKRCKKRDYLIALIPGSFYMFIISSFILSQKIGFGLPMTVAYIIAGILTALYFAGLIMAGKKYAANHEEE